MSRYFRTCVVGLCWSSYCGGGRGCWAFGARAWGFGWGGDVAGSEPGQRCADGNLLPDRHEDRFDDAVLENFNFDVGLFGVDHRDDVAAMDRVAGVDKPFRDGSGFHVRTEGWHAEVSHR